MDERVNESYFLVIMEARGLIDSRFRGNDSRMGLDSSRCKRRTMRSCRECQLEEVDFVHLLRMLHKVYITS